MQGEADLGGPSGRCCSTTFSLPSPSGVSAASTAPTNTILSQQARHEREIARFDEQIASIERQIQLNEEAARKCIGWRVSRAGVSGLRQANTRSGLRRDELRERDAKPLGSRPMLLGLMSSLADGVGIYRPGAVPAGLLPVYPARCVWCRVLSA